MLKNQNNNLPAQSGPQRLPGVPPYGYVSVGWKRADCQIPRSDIPRPGTHHSPNSVPPSLPKVTTPAPPTPPTPLTPLAPQSPHPGEQTAYVITAEIARIHMILRNIPVLFLAVL